MATEPARGRHRDAGRDLPVLVWRFPEPRLAVSSAGVGGGLGLRSWILNAQVPRDYARTDLDAHVREIARAHGCATPDGVGLLTAADVAGARAAGDDGVAVWATVGLGLVTWAAAEPEAVVPGPGTINVVALLPRRLSEAALVNAVVTATEAKTQALLELGIDGTGTPSDAVCIACPDRGPAEPFGGPRAPTGAALARAVHDAVRRGAEAWA